MIALFFLCLLFYVTIQQGLGGAFGEEIAWKNYADGIEAIRANHKPGMLVFHRGSCPSCHRLAMEVKGNQKVIKLSKHFVMISCDGNEPKSDLFTFDGNYYPRIFFVYPNNTIDFQFVSNPANFQYRYFYRGADQLIGRMKDFLKLLKEEHSREMNLEKQEEVEL